VPGRHGRYTPEVFTAAPGNAFAGRDVTAIALQLDRDAQRAAELADRRLGARDVRAEQVAGGAPIVLLCGWLGLRLQLAFP
jgi:hypothetical protein